MATGKILMLEGEHETLIGQAPYQKESELQEYLARHPGLIPLAEIEGREIELLLIGTEVTLPTGAAIDVLFVDNEATITIVETKLAWNSELRRTVIGQILEYAAYIAEWGVRQIEDAAAAYRRKTPPPTQISDSELSAKLTQPEFRAALEKNLKAARLRLIVAADDMIEPLQRTATFLNAASRFDIYVLQIQRFKDGEGRIILVPSLLETTARPPEPGWDLARFLADIARRCHEEVVTVSRHLHDFASELSQRGQGYDLTWGKGAVYGSFTCKKRLDTSWATLFTVQSDGRLYLDFGPKNKALLTQTLDAFHHRLTQIPHVVLPPDVLDQAVNRYPSIPLQPFVQPEHLEALKQAILGLA